MAVRKGRAKTGGLGIGARITLTVTGTLGAGLIFFALVLQSSLASLLSVRAEEAALTASKALAASGWNSWAVPLEKGKQGVRKGSRDRLGRLVRESRGSILNAWILRGRASPHQYWHPIGNFRPSGEVRQAGGTRIQEGTWGGGKARLYRTALRDEEGIPRGYAVLVASAKGGGGSLAGLLLGGGILLLLATAGACLASAGRVTSTLATLVQAVSRLNRGNLHYRSMIRGNDEIARLSRAIEDMTETLRVGEEATEALSAHQREIQLLTQLQTALLPKELPVVEGFEIDSEHVPGTEGVAGFFDAVPLGGGRLALIVASTSGSGLLGSLLAALARAYLRAYLEESRDAGKALRNTNRNLAESMKKGLHVTMQVAVLDPEESRATVCIAGHRAPFYACRSGEISVVHGEGLALGLDKGPVFDKRLEEVQVDMPPGTRILLTTTGTYEFQGRNGRNFGIDRFQDLVRKHAPKNSAAFLNLVHSSLDDFLGGNERPQDITLVTAKRMV